MTIERISLNVPQSHLKSSILIWSLTEEWVGSSLGKDKSWTIRRSDESCAWEWYLVEMFEKGRLEILTWNAKRGRNSVRETILYEYVTKHVLGRIMLSYD